MPADMSPEMAEEKPMSPEMMPTDSDVMPADTVPKSSGMPAEMPADADILPATPSVEGLPLPPANEDAPDGQDSVLPGCSVDHEDEGSPGCE
jgi:hypothetical protein